MILCTTSSILCHLLSVNLVIAQKTWTVQRVSDPSWDWDPEWFGFLWTAPHCDACWTARRYLCGCLSFYYLNNSLNHYGVERVFPLLFRIESLGFECTPPAKPSPNPLESLFSQDEITLLELMSIQNLPTLVKETSQSFSKKYSPPHSGFSTTISWSKTSLIAHCGQISYKSPSLMSLGLFSRPNSSHIKKKSSTNPSLTRPNQQSRKKLILTAEVG